ncbi:ribulose-phosphate 3-epimerase [Campylobacter hyointestinalis]|uniref:ribulose-phosphate 3-epimerase n=1 Tax=Campylobacter hyointestinalis TaxID=198 RepID=UPI0011AE0202|nr:ribulose-phosphate 3-epimerase [Campylobacter hyointestinalis]MBT0611457.1 ribulose-phosphate 3-epimerase [Campylobacter hyointestinalis subsp. hyointestinalis]MDY2998998.1 ribulose-phosphate 3-epimerase [Campylobacter hyointestinalis]TWO28638.1 ribulose-phosphate 3-epimerase [Campylobacter hyointestinalis]
MYVAPSILSADFGRLDDEVKAICEAGADLVHVDVMDGHFVPNLTMGPLVVNAVAKSSTKPLDIHLMVENVPFFVDLFLPLKPKFISFHIEEEKHPLRLCDHIRKNGVNPAIVLNPHTPVSSLEYIINDVDMVLLMSVNPGFSGQKFIPSVLDKAKQLRELIESKNAACLIEVDGGVNGLNVSELDEAGVDIVVAGNFVFSSSDYAEAIKALKL